MSKQKFRHSIVFWIIIGFLYVSGCGGGQDSANPVLERAVLTNEEHTRADSLFRQALVHAKNYQIQPALSFLEATLEVDSTHYLAYFQKGMLLRRLNEFDASSQAYQSAVRYNPDLLDAWYNLANNAFWQNNHVDAIALYDQLLEKSEAPPFLHNKGRAHMALGEYEQALESFNRSVLLDSSYAYGYASMGALAEIQGEYDGMHQHYLRAVQFAPMSDEYWYKLGMANMRQGNHALALNAWDSTLSLNPFHFGALFNKGKILNQEGHPGARVLLEKAESIRQVDAEMQRLKRGSERFPEDAYYRHALGNLYVEREQWEAAIREFRIATGLETQGIRSLINLGNVHVMLGEPSQAIGAYKKALEIEPESIDVLRNLAIVLMNQGQAQAALEYWERIIELDPDHPVAKRGVQQLRNK